MPVTVKTNHQWRDLLFWSDVPAKVRDDQFDYMTEEDSLDGFFKYRGYWYHVNDFIAVPGSNGVPENNPLAGWHGYASDSYFSGVVIRLSKDGEQVKIGRYLA